MDPTAALSNEVCLMIGEFCTVPDLARLAQTHHRFNNLFRSSIWERNIRDEPYCDSCLLYAAAHRRLDILEIALEFGADMNGGPVPVRPSGTRRPRPILTGLDWARVTAYNLEYIAPRPLHIAAWNGDLEMANFLLDNGALLEVSWLKCEPDFDRATQRLPAFLQPEVLTRKPLPPSGIRPYFTLDQMVRDANRLRPFPLGSEEEKRFIPFIHSVLALSTGRDLRHVDPLGVALGLSEDTQVASALIGKSSPLPERFLEKALIRSVFLGNIDMFNRLLELYPEVDGENDIRYRILYILGGDEFYDMPMEMVRHAFLKIWMPRLPLFDELRAFGSAHTSLIFWSIVTGRFREALLHIRGVVDLKIGRELGQTLLHHVWWDGVASVPLDRSTVGDVRLPDENPTATRCELTRTLLRHSYQDRCLLKLSHSSDKMVSALYLAAVGSESCPHRFEAVRLMLEAGHKQDYVITMEPDKSLSLLQFYAEQAASDRDMRKWCRPLQLCLDHRARLGDLSKLRYPMSMSTLEYSITAWVEPDGRRPLFGFFLEHATCYNVEIQYIRSLAHKYDGVEETPIRDALFELLEKVFGQKPKVGCLK